MGSSNNKFIVPEKERREFDLMVQRANRRIKSNFKYLSQAGITNENTTRALVGKYEDLSEWSTDKTVFSRSKTFENSQAYEAFKRHVGQWGNKKSSRTVDAVKEDYIKSIIQSLTTSAINNNVTLENDRLPGNIKAKLKSLSLNQLTHFFESSEPVDDLEYMPYSEVDFTGVDSKGFVENVDTIINSLRQVYPNRNERVFKQLTEAGKSPREALKEIFPKATPHQIGYYLSKTGNIPEVYKAPKKRRRKRKR